MTTTLTKLGDQLGLILDQATLEQLGIDEQTQIMVTTTEGGIFLRPIRFARTEQVEGLIGGIMRTHSETLRRLAE